MKVALVGLNSDCAEWAMEHLARVGVLSQHCSAHEILMGETPIVPGTILVIDVRYASSCDIDTIRTIRSRIGNAPGILAVANQQDFISVLDAGADLHLESTLFRTVLSAMLFSLYRRLQCNLSAPIFTDLHSQERSPAAIPLRDGGG